MELYTDQRPLTTVYMVRDASGRHIADHVREDKADGDKECRWRLPDGTWGLNGTKLAELPLYGAEHVANWNDDELVVVVEGEKARDALHVTGCFRALGTVCGASATPGAEALEVLRGRRVCLWADNDQGGRQHMERIAQALGGVADEVLVYTWDEAPDKGDAADHHAIDSGKPKALDRLLTDLEGSPVYSHHIDGGFGGNKNPLPIKTVDEVIAEAGEEVPWVQENVLARGSLTEFSGLAKRGGKTTYWLHAIAAGARGEEHAGFATTPAKYLYLTEQGNNFAGALRDSGLADYPDHICIVQFKDVSAVQWDTLIHQAGAEANRRNLDALVVDTFAVFARLKGSEENDSGPVADRMRVLRLVAQKYNIAVALVRHAGKDGTPRGSSAFEAEADICVTLSRPEGRHSPSVRRIAGIGRYGEWERNIQLVDGRFISLGTDNKIEFNKAVRFIKSVLPGSPEGGAKKQEILDKRTGPDEELTASTIDRALAWLVRQGDVGEKQMMDQRGKPKVYWLAYKPPGNDGPIDSHQTPSIGDENKPKAASRRVVDDFEDPDSGSVDF